MAQSPQPKAHSSPASMADVPQWQTVGFVARVCSQAGWRLPAKDGVEGLRVLSSCPMNAVVEEMQRVAREFGGNLAGQRINKKKLKQTGSLLLEALSEKNFRVFRVSTRENIPMCLAKGLLHIGKAKRSYVLARALNPLKPKLPEGSWKVESQRPG